MSGFALAAATTGREQLGAKAGRFVQPTEVQIIAAPRIEREGGALSPTVPPQVECARTDCVKHIVNALERAASKAACKVTRGIGLYPALVFESLAGEPTLTIRPWAALIGRRFAVEGESTEVTLRVLDGDRCECDSGGGASVTYPVGKLALVDGAEQPSLIFPNADKIVSAGGPVALRKRFKTLVHDARPPSQRDPQSITSATESIVITALCEVRDVVQKHASRSVPPASSMVTIREVASEKMVKVEGFGFSHSISLAHIAKLRELYRGPTDAFNDALFVLLQRYYNLCGADRAELEGGWHGAVPLRVMQAMATYLGVLGEGFASPLNCSFPNFCSAFDDTDKAFGSLGSFFDWEPMEGCFEINPPFDHTVALRAAQRMNKLLCAASAGQRALGFVVVLPFADKGKPLPSVEAVVTEMRSGGFVRAESTVEAMKCDYVDGLQHCATNTSFVARLDTRVFVLQTDRQGAQFDADSGVRRVVEAWVECATNDACTSPPSSKKNRAE